jgi:hypothetical protein
MAGQGIKLFTDEMVDPELAAQRARRGYDAESTHAAGRANRNISDNDQLHCAALHGRAILTNNITEFYGYDAEWKAAGRTHAGVILYPDMNFAELLHRVMHHLDIVSPQTQHNTVLWLASGG